MYQVKRLKMHCASKMWDMASEETMTSFLRWEIQANFTQLQDKCMSHLEWIFPHVILTYDWAVVCTNHPEFMHNLHRRSKLICFEHTHHSEFIRVAMEAEEEQWRQGRIYVGASWGSRPARFGITHKYLPSSPEKIWAAQQSQHPQPPWRLPGCRLDRGRRQPYLGLYLLPL
jgi:hypothetical protein